jgi:hypothetical protein
VDGLECARRSYGCALHLPSSLTKNEEDQIFLDDSFNHIKSEQAAIVARVNKIQPLLKVALSLVGVATVCVLGYYVIDIFNQFK